MTVTRVLMESVKLSKFNKISTQYLASANSPNS